jgi:hypothetical protein
MNTIELKKMIKAFLATKSSRVYDTQAPAKIEYPYVVYTLDNSTPDENVKREDFTLVIDIFDNNQFNATDIETLAGTIDGDGAIVSASGLHRKHYFSNGVLQADFYRTNRDTIEEEDPKIRHMQLIYDVMSYLA